MIEEFDLSEIEERLYSQIYHSTADTNENHPMELNPSNINPKRRYFNTGFNTGIKNISVRIDVRDENQARCQRHNFRESSYQPPAKSKRHRKEPTMLKRYTKNMQHISNYDNINLKEIKMQVDAFPEFIKCLPPHIRKKLKYMNKRLAYIQKKKYLEKITKLKYNKSASVTVTKPKIISGPVTKAIETLIKVEHSAKDGIVCEEDDIISISDEDTKVSNVIKMECIDIFSSDDETHTNKAIDNCTKVYNSPTASTNMAVFKRPDDDEVMLIEPIAADIINLEIDAESTCSTSTKSSIDRTGNNRQTYLEKHRILHKERKELLSTPESNNSNDFLESSLATDKVSWGFNFGLHGSDFGPSKDSTQLNAKDVSGSESSCSVAACDLGSLLASNKCALFNEVDFESPSKNIFEESSLKSFGDYITPNREGNKSEKNTLMTKRQREQLPNLSSIAPEDNKDMDASLLAENEPVPTRNKKKKKNKMIVEVNTNDGAKGYNVETREFNKKKKSKVVEQRVTEDIPKQNESDASRLPNLKKKDKKLQVVKQQTVVDAESPGEIKSVLNDLQITKKNKKNKLLGLIDNSNSDMDSFISNEAISINTDDANIAVKEKFAKKKKSKMSNTLEDIDNTELDLSIQIIEDAVVDNILIKRKKYKKRNTSEHIENNEINSCVQVIEQINIRDEEPKKKRTKKSLNCVDNDKSEKDSSLQIIEKISGNTDVSPVSAIEEPKKRKHKSKKIDHQFPHTVDLQCSQEISASVIESISDYSLESGENTMKRKHKGKPLVAQPDDTDDTETNNLSDAEPVKRSRKRKKSKTLQNSVLVDTSKTESVPLPNCFESDAIVLETSTGKIVKGSWEKASSEDVDTHLLATSETVSISSDSDSNVDFASIKDKVEDLEVVNVVFKEEAGHDYDEKDHVENILSKMSDEASKWKIIPADRQSAKSPKFKIRCRKCRELGHYANRCTKKPLSICYLCAGRGHLEPRCPNKMCTNCGRRSKFFTTFCSRCAHTKQHFCKICKLKGHDQSMCPDLWRRYHLTTCNGPIVRPTPRNEEQQAVKWCSGCGKRDHLEYQCQYFARDHYPTGPNVINYKDHLYKGGDAASPVNLKNRLTPLISATSTPVQSLNAVQAPTKLETLSTSSTVSIIGKSLTVDATPSSKQCSSTDVKPALFKTILPIPQPIGSSTVKQEAMLDVITQHEPTRSLPQASKLQHPLFPCSTQLHVSYLHAKYLQLHEAGISFIKNQTSDGTMDIELYPDGLVNIRGLQDSYCASAKATISSYLQSVSHLTIPTEKAPLISFLEVILMDLSKESTVHKLKIRVTQLQDGSCPNNSFSIQQLNMRIYGYFKWEYGERLTDRVKSILTTVKESYTINYNLLNELKQCIQYLIESERPIQMYRDIIESISEGKTNFFNVSSLRIPNQAPLEITLPVIIDPIKFEYVRYSFPAKFMICRWRTKLDVTLCDEKDKILALILKGGKEDVKIACEEFKMLVGEGSALPLRKWAVFNIISHVLEQIHVEEPSCDNLNGKMRQNLNDSNIYCRRSMLKRIHIHLIVTRGLNGGREKMIILQEFLKNYKPSIQDDNLSDVDRQEIQQAFNIIQFNVSKNISEYSSLYLSASTTTVDRIILKLNKYNCLKKATDDFPLNKKIVLSAPETINSTHISIAMDGKEDDRRKFKVFVYDYLDRDNILDKDPQSLRLKLENSLNKLWTTRFNINKAQLIFNRIHQMESKTIASYNIEHLRKLYQQLHMYFFGCCRLNSRTAAEVPSNNHVDSLRGYIAYLGTIKEVPSELQMDIYKKYNYIFGKEKMDGVDYKLLIIVSWMYYNKYKDMDKKTILICNSRVKSYLSQPTMTSSWLVHSSIQPNPCIENESVQKYMNTAFMIIIRKMGSSDYNSHLVAHCESFKLFSDSYYNISANLSSSLQTIDEINSHFDYTKALNLLHHIHILETNSPNSGEIAEKYQILNTYLFGCCQLMDGMKHLNLLKMWQIQFSQPDKADQYITDTDLINMLIDAYEYIFWKGKKLKLNYRILINRTGITSHNVGTSIIPLPTNYIYDYFMNVKEGINVIKTCLKLVKVNIINDQTNENKAFISLTGGSETLLDVIALLLKEIDDVHIFKDIPLQSDPLCKYINWKLEEVMNAECGSIPLTTLQAVTKEIDPSLPYPDYSILCSRNQNDRAQLNSFIFAINPTEERQKHLNSLKTFELTQCLNPGLILNASQIISLRRSLDYLFSQEFDVQSYIKHLNDASNISNVKAVTKLNLPPLVYKHIKITEYLSSISLTNVVFQFSCETPYVLVSGSKTYVNWLRNIFRQFNQILTIIPTNRKQLVMFLKDTLSSIQEDNDPKSIWTNICLLEQTHSSQFPELNDLYVKLHRHLFGYHGLENGKALKQVLTQHLINLDAVCNSVEIVSFEIIQEIFFALDYIEGSSKHFSSQQYEEFINKCCIGMKNESSCNSTHNDHSH